MKKNILAMITVFGVSTSAFAGIFGYSEFEIYNEKLMNANIQCNAAVTLSNGENAQVTFTSNTRRYYGPESLKVSINNKEIQVIGTSAFNIMSLKDDMVVLETNRLGDIQISSLEKVTDRNSAFKEHFLHGGRKADVWSLSIKRFMNDESVKSGTIQIDSSALGEAEGRELILPVACRVN